MTKFSCNVGYIEIALNLFFSSKYGGIVVYIKIVFVHNQSHLIEFFGLFLNITHRKKDKR